MPPATILIADDDRTITTVISAALRGQGYRVIVAHDAVQVAMFARKERPDAIVVDIHMPGGTGLEAIKRIRTSSLVAHVPVVAISGLPQADIEEKCRAAGATAFLPKPIDLGRLTTLLREYLGGAPV
jgi:CheY-like chemotaxis protein